MEILHILIIFKLKMYVGTYFSCKGAQVNLYTQYIAYIKKLYNSTINNY